MDIGGEVELGVEVLHRRVFELQLHEGAHALVDVGEEDLDNSQVGPRGDSYVCIKKVVDVVFKEDLYADLVEEGVGVVKDFSEGFLEAECALEALEDVRVDLLPGELGVFDLYGGHEGRGGLDDFKEGVVGEGEDLALDVHVVKGGSVSVGFGDGDPGLTVLGVDFGCEGEACDVVEFS